MVTGGGGQAAITIAEHATGAPQRQRGCLGDAITGLCVDCRPALLAWPRSLVRRGPGVVVQLPKSSSLLPWRMLRFVQALCLPCHSTERVAGGIERYSLHVH